MKVISGADLLNLGKAMARLEDYKRTLREFCAQQFICDNGHETNGGMLTLEQTKCKCGATLKRL